MKTFYSDYTSEITNKIDNNERSIIHVITTGDKNRLNQVVNPQGWNNQEEYKKNPIVLFNHGGGFFGDASSHIFSIGTSEFQRIKANHIEAKTVFGTTELANDIFNLNVEKVLNSWSIGFNPVDEPKFMNDALYINKWDMLEYSSVYIPANANCTNLEIMSNSLNIVKNGYLKNFITDKHLEIEQSGEVNKLKLELETIKNSYKTDFDKYKADFENTLKTTLKNFYKVTSENLITEFNGTLSKHLKDVPEMINQTVLKSVKTLMGKLD